MNYDVIFPSVRQFIWGVFIIMFSLIRYKLNLLLTVSNFLSWSLNMLVLLIILSEIKIPQSVSNWELLIFFAVVTFSDFASVTVDYAN